MFFRSRLSSAQIPLSPAPGLIRHLRRTERELRRVPKEELSPAGTWMEDHGRFLAEEARALHDQIKKTPPLPARDGAPRMLALARQICRGEIDRLDEKTLLRAARDFEGNQDYTIQELALFPQALSMALFERLEGVLLRCRQESRGRKQAEKWLRSFKKGNPQRLPDQPLLLALAARQMTQQEDAEGLRRFKGLLAQAGKSPEEVLAAAREQWNRDAETARQIILALRSLPRLHWDGISERLSPLAAALRQEDTYRQMDAKSRAYYRQCAARIARKIGVSEAQVAHTALAMADGKAGREGQAGYYLLERPDQIARQLGKRLFFVPPGRRPGLFLLGLYGLSAAIAGLGLWLGAPLFSLPFAALAASEWARLLLDRLVRRFVPARMLPRLSRKTLTPRDRTLVVIPALLTSPRQALRMARQLAVLHSANPDPCLEFMLLGDFADQAEAALPEDDALLETARRAIDALNEAQSGTFYFLHRCRKWDAAQRRFTGRERKRGALEALNRLLVQGDARDSFAYMSCAPERLAGRFAYVITLDADTLLPPGAAGELIGTLAHPLQKGRLAVVQPRMAVGADTVRTRIQRWLGGPGGADPYHLSVQDLYQDLFGRGSFVGKGIYDPALWLERLDGRLPSGRLLSHDLIEGEIAVSALADDIVCFDGHPEKLAGWQKRLHRWTRGDWQLLPFLWDPRLDFLSRHKIWDNLRRSLVPLAQGALLLLGAGMDRPLLVLFALPWPFKGMLLRLSLLPAKAITLLDAAVRALYRQFISHRQLLSWVTAAQAEAGSQLPLSCILCQVGMGTAMTALSLLPGGFLPGAFIGLLWAASPLLAGYADRPLQPELPMTDRQKALCRALGRDTWRFFADYVTARTLYLPPDNVQSDPEKGPALRTSPTNIGLYLLSCAAARELSFLSSAQMARRIADTLGTLEKLDTWKGHFYNWYELDQGQPLPPAFVSTVDSGNLAACLMACAQLCRQRMAEFPPAYQGLPARLDALAARMDFAALYDPRAQLFYVGMDVEKGRPTAAHYDLLASEARLTSFLAVMTGQVPLRHWRHLGRAVAYLGGGPALLSWGGTLFEYLMPHLLLPLFPGTLLDQGCRCAVRAQMAAHPFRPFGISESGYYAFDPDLNYQYRAFGLPNLALAPDTAGSVIAPYASLLALPFFPRAAAANLQRMARRGWMDGYGLFEAVDYGPQRVEKGPRIIKSHMAHHQGMILCALCNALENQALVRAFMAPPSARAYAFLLMEPAPRHARRRQEWSPVREDSHPLGELRRASHPGLPVDAQALYGSGMRWILTARGQGFLACREGMITRFDPEAGAQTGPQFYLRDEMSGAFFRPAILGNALFDGGKARYAAQWQGLRVVLQCCVHPIRAVAVAWLRIENPGAQDRTVEAVSFLEVALGPQADDAAHPNFRDLSVRVVPWRGTGLAAQRLPREEKDAMPWVLHSAAGDINALRRQGDRLLFLGREGTYARPLQLSLAPEDCVFRTGDVIAPCLSLRIKSRVPAGGKANVYFFVCTAASLEDGDALALTPPLARNAFPLAASQAQMTLRFLRMDARGLFLCQQLLGTLLFTGQPHTAFPCPASRGVLWRMGISGVFPVWMVDLRRGMDPALTRHALRAHRWMAQQGIVTDLLFFCPPETQYQRPVWDQARHWAELGDPAHVFVFAGTEVEAQAAASQCRLTLRGGSPLGAQLSALQLLPAPVPQGVMLEPRPLPPAGFVVAHPWGGFTSEGHFCVLRVAPAPWHNILAGPQFGTLVCENAILYAYAGNSRLGRITRIPPDVHRGVGSEEIYAQDADGALYPLIRCAAVHEPGVTVYRTDFGVLQGELTVFSSPDQPLGIRALTLRSSKACRLRICYLVRFALGEHPETTCASARDPLVLARNGDFSHVAWAALEGGRCQALAPASAFGMAGEAVPPALLAPAHGGGSVGLLTRAVDVRPHAPIQLLLALGCAADETQAKTHWQACVQQGAAALLLRVRTAWADQLGGLLLFSSGKALDRLMNLWLPYQVRASRLMARMGPYQPGGAFGFRDQLQDLLSLLPTDAPAARKHILLCAAHQFPEGDVQHWWHEPRKGVRTRISDDKLFLPYLTAQYVKITGDESILNTPVPYLQSAPLAPEEEDRYEQPAPTPWEEPLLDHCLRALNSVSLGSHGLPLMGAGDWNDGMNRVGGQRGESVWLGFFLAIVLRDFAPLCPTDQKERLRALRRQVLDAAESAWTGQWYLRAWYDDGAPLGGPDTQPPRIDLISQCFAVLAGAPRAHGRLGLMHAVRLLYDREAGLVKLLSPPFTPQEKAGYIGAYLPGVRENGGQYTHAVPWLILALCKVGEYALAWEIARAILPWRPGDSPEKMQRYRLEPYVLAGDVYAGENRGRGGWSWYTGSAAWLYYAVLTALLGFEKRGDRVRLFPCPGPNTEEYTLIYRWGHTRYELTAAPDVPFPTLDGEKLSDGWIPLRDDRKTHTAYFPLRKGG